jgi:hypothetical protein
MLSNTFKVKWYVQGKTDHLNNQEKKLIQDVKNGKGEKEAKLEDNKQEQTTTNGVF